MNEHSDLLRRHAEDIEGMLGCFDRVVITGTLVEVAHPQAVAALLRQLGIRCFDLGQFAEPLRAQVRVHAQSLAAEHGLTIEHLDRKGVRKEERIAAILRQRGAQPGLVHIFSAMENCKCYKPWHDKRTGRTGLKITSGRCLHYYFYLIDEQLGLCYVRVPTWLPFRLQVYFNAHQWLAAQLHRQGIGFEMRDNCFVRIDDWQRAQALADGFSIAALQRTLDGLARRFMPLLKQFRGGYHWSLMQVEYALDIAWKRRERLAAVYGEISRQAILVVQAAEVARFLGKRLSPQAQAQSDYHTRVEGTRVKHALGKQSLKMYDKGGRVLRIECTSNDVTFFRHYRKVAKRDGSSEYKEAALKKSIYSLGDLRGLLHAACRRYLEFVGTLEDRSTGKVDLERITQSVRDEGNRSWRGFNFFSGADLRVLLAVVRGEYCVSGLTNRWLRGVLAGLTAGQVGRVLKRLRLHGLIRKVGQRYKYYVTALGRRAIVAARRVMQEQIVPSLATAF